MAPHGQAEKVTKKVSKVAKVTKKVAGEK